MAVRPPDSPLDSPQASHAPDGGDVRLGELLRTARQRRGLTLQQIAEDTKIPVRHLASLEREDLTSVPRGLYRRAEVRAFAKAAGADEREALRSLERLETPPAQLVPPPPVAPARSLARPRIELVIGLGIVAAVVFGRLMWERSAMRNPEDRPPVVNLSTGEVIPAAHVTAGDGTEASEPGTLVPAALPLDERGDAPISADDTEATSGQTLETETPPQAPGDVSAAPPVTAGITELVVTTEPPGGRVTVNGVGWGDAPVTIRHLPPGTKHIRVTKDGYQGAARVVEVTEGRRSRVVIRLQASEL